MASNKSIYPKLWVALSVALLSLFLVYWNYNNYQIQERQLKQTLNGQLQLAYSEIMDSVFVEQIIVMTKINGFDVNFGNNTMKMGDATFEATSDSFHQKLKFVDLNERPDFRDSFQIITYDDELYHKANLKMNKDSIEMMQFQIGLGEIQTDMEAQADQVSVMIENMFTAKEDYKPKIISTFLEKLKVNNYPSSIADSSESQSKGLLIEHKGDREFDTLVSLTITDHPAYLIKSIMPSILFSLLLLGIVILAFWSLLTNWTKQQKLIDIKNEFVSNMTHELKTPISTVGVALEAIAGFDLTQEEEKTKEYVDISRHELNRLSLLVDKVLKMAAFDSTTNEMKKSTIDLDQTISKILRSMKLQVEEKNASIQYTNKGIDSKIIGDQVHISNVIYNILDNALKYSNIDPKINVLLENTNDHIILKIADNGKGIPAEYIDKIFDRFFRIPTSDRHNVKGHGLGLSYVKDVITKHDGVIHATSIEQEGTTFIIKLPKSDNNA